MILFFYLGFKFVLFCFIWGFCVCLVFKKTFKTNVCCIPAGIASSQWGQPADPWQYELSLSLHSMLLDPWMDFPLEKKHCLLSSSRLTHY